MTPNAVQYSSRLVIRFRYCPAFWTPNHMVPNMCSILKAKSNTPSLPPVTIVYPNYGKIFLIYLKYTLDHTD